jgi:hypothetical protein
MLHQKCAANKKRRGFQLKAPSCKLRYFTYNSLFNCKPFCDNNTIGGFNLHKVHS